MKLACNWADRAGETEYHEMRKDSSQKDLALQPRLAALQVLKEVNKDGRYANISLKENLRNRSLTGRDAAFTTQLVYGCLEKQITIDYYLRKLANLKRVNPWIENILRLGAYQILFMDGVPDFAACNEAVKLCKAHGLYALKGFVNGILRNIARKKEKLMQPDPNLSTAENLSLLYSYPQWLVEKWIKDYGQVLAEDIMKPINAGNMTTIRVNTMKTSKEVLRDELLSLGLEVYNGLHVSESLRVSNGGDVGESVLFQSGCFTVQGESSMLVSHIVDPQPGETILDACSSPGGKAIHMAELMNGQGRVVAWDIHAHRVDLIKVNCLRMGAEIVEPSLVDASVPDSAWNDQFDRVLIDAPCSGLGIVHKKPDIKLNISQEALQELPELQAKILSACRSYVKPGGVLVYSTCTINPAENEEIIRAFLANNPEYYLEDVLSIVPDSLHSAVQNRLIQLIPSRHGIDGFFIARMRRSLFDRRSQ
ncbi:MAG: 16S rRNA (cytosine(967)-C(5))-methyltransferase RsmB [Caldicoprobacterales bacterium]|nr:16S rRNA (cytosine(967)-C(5))-methyltransferase RsmB [Clostridiales bacterium]